MFLFSVRTSVSATQHGVSAARCCQLALPDHRQTSSPSVARYLYRGVDYFIIQYGCPALRAADSHRSPTDLILSERAFILVVTPSRSSPTLLGTTLTSSRSVLPLARRIADTLQLQVHRIIRSTLLPKGTLLQIHAVERTHHTIMCIDYRASCHVSEPLLHIISSGYPHALHVFGAAHWRSKRQNLICA